MGSLPSDLWQEAKRSTGLCCRLKEFPSQLWNLIKFVRMRMDFSKAGETSSPLQCYYGRTIIHLLIFLAMLCFFSLLFIFFALCLICSRRIRIQYTTDKTQWGRTKMHCRGIYSNFTSVVRIKYLFFSLNPCTSGSTVDLRYTKRIHFDHVRSPHSIETYNKCRLPWSGLCRSIKF